MKSLMTQLIKAIREDTRSSRVVAEETGLNVTRIFRLRNGSEMKASEFIQLTEYYGLSTTTQKEKELEIAISEAKKEKEQAFSKATSEVFALAEQKIAANYGLTPEYMNWKLSELATTKNQQEVKEA